MVWLILKNYIYAVYLHVPSCIKIYNLKNKYISNLPEKEPFYKTSAYYEGVTFLGNGGKILCLEGLWGSGKTSTAKQVYMAVTNSTTIIISDLLAFDARKHYKPIIVTKLS